ncbi:phosphoglucosamine mutase [Halopelagius longus]|uniref:Phosphoglucosamine mutase n=1 Tax=Halopelagius longus TaxID=1236180 RepID=A0A1H1GGI3_9EURY|nr:phosphoglucosamine mutase [Halopelagius longus]RDI69619.1 phosphoglucosamine mutase [Halopelagius longus]SDR11998.1 phosphoglucosamine mutase [Halopelagius longus]
MFGTSGIRGAVGETVTADLALRIGQAVAADADRVVLGKDVRDSGRMLADALSAGLRECGTDVVRIGVASTPTVARCVEWLDADAGVAVTASHNPAPDNGIKLWNPSGQAFDGEQTDAITRRLESDDVERARWDELGRETEDGDATRRHVEALSSSFESMDGLDVLVDLGNGTGRATVDALYELDATVNTLDGQMDGRFPARKSEPNAETLSLLRAAVPAAEADVGIAHDGDSDRMVAVSETGSYVPGDVLLALFARDAVSAGDKVAVPVDTSLLVSDVVEAEGGEVVYTPVGDVHVAEAVAQSGFVFGGEPSGAWIWPDETLAPDGHYAALRLADLVRREGPLSELVAELDEYRYETCRMNVTVEDKAESMARIRESLLAEYDRVDTTDGVRVETDDGWFLVRASGTEPLVRVTAEARDESAANDLLESARGVVESDGIVA